MFRKGSLATSAAVIAALAVSAPVASANPASTSVTDAVSGSPSCPPGYVGPTNLATGCPYWMVS